MSGLFPQRYPEYLLNVREFSVPLFRRLLSGLLHGLILHPHSLSLSLPPSLSLPHSLPLSLPLSLSLSFVDYIYKADKRAEVATE